MGFHPAASGAGNPFAAIQQGLDRIGRRLRAVEVRPPSGMATATRIDSPPPATSSGSDVGLWRLAAAPAGTSSLLGLDAQLTGTAVGAVTIWGETTGLLEEFDVPFTGDAGPYPSDSGALTVAARRTAGTGSVVVDVTGCRYGSVLIDDSNNDDGSGDGSGDPSAGDTQAPSA